MNRLELICKLQEKEGLSRAEASKAVRLFFNEIEDSMAGGKRVEIRGLFSFFIKEYKSYVGKNPKSGKQFVVKEKKLPFFKCGKELRDRVNS